VEKGCHADDEREGLQLMDLVQVHVEKFQNNSQKKFQRGHIFRKRMHRLRDKVDGPTSKHPTDIDCGQSRHEHGGYQRKCH
jgi:hypothetical protein